MGIFEVGKSSRVERDLNLATLSGVKDVKWTTFCDWGADL